MGYLIGAAVIAIVGLILWIVKGKKEGQSAAMELADTSKVSEVNELFESISGSMGSGSFTHFCEIKGVAYTDNPLKSQLAEAEVVYYKSVVEHKYERLENKKDSNGNITKQWVKHTDIVSENEQWAQGWGVKDETGFIKIDPGKAKLHTESLMSKFEQGEPQQSGLSVKIGGFSLGIGGGNNGHKTIGYNYREEGIKLNTELYVLGDANDRDGALKVSKPQDNKQPFIVSTKSEDELVSGLGSSIKGLKIGAFVCWGLGAALVVAGLLNILGIF
ncbi:E3 ubiquitin ligase family protein [Paracrocinitomix mangrovi]|uniref:E3 ubiquitin ligase family protein n=1 Tax=Paracrocinitomix mangrovi TaxID=2862509 RepID=UPI001C8D90E9|nr:E3 ubiquitin ligase family protein [Paracrocinitomix mangrovi]UKN02680.1 E3 ubiquitin ligase family protein [Paracrocinitomix mangrovi]